MTVPKNLRFLAPALLGAVLAAVGMALLDDSETYEPFGMAGPMAQQQFQVPQGYGGQGYGDQAYAQQQAQAAAWLQQLGYAAQQQQQQPTTDNYWYSDTGMGNSNADNSAGYVHMPSSTGGSGTTVSYGY